MKITNLVSTPLSWAWSQVKTSWYGRSVVIILGGGSALVYYFLRQRRGAPSPSQKPTAPQQPPAPPSKPAAPQPKGPSAPPPAKPAPARHFPFVTYLKSDDAFERQHVQPVTMKILEITNKLPEWHEGLPKGSPMELDYLQKLKGFIERFQAGIPHIVNTMREDLWFDGYSTDVWNTFLSEATGYLEDMKPGKKVESKTIFEKMKSLITKVRNEQDILRKFVSDRIKGLLETGKVPHYWLDNRERYVSYVRLNPDELELEGRSINDVGLNYFTFFEAAISHNFLPSIENLRMLSIYLRFELQKRNGRELTHSLHNAYWNELRGLTTKLSHVLLEFEKESIKDPLSKVGLSLITLTNNAINPENITSQSLDQLQQYLNELEQLDPEKQLLQIKRFTKNIATSINRPK